MKFSLFGSSGLILLLVLWGFLSGCGGGDGGQTSAEENRISSNLINGDNYDDADTFWECYTDGVNVFDLEFYPSGNGTYIDYLLSYGDEVSFRYSLNGSELKLTVPGISEDYFEVLRSSRTQLMLNLFRTVIGGSRVDRDVFYNCQLEDYY